jgi:hypothetical protein
MWSFSKIGKIEIIINEKLDMVQQQALQQKDPDRSIAEPAQSE